MVQMEIVNEKEKTNLLMRVGTFSDETTTTGTSFIVEDLCIQYIIKTKQNNTNFFYLTYIYLGLPFMSGTNFSFWIFGKEMETSKNGSKWIVCFNLIWLFWEIEKKKKRRKGRRRRGPWFSWEVHIRTFLACNNQWWSYSPLTSAVTPNNY